ERHDADVPSLQVPEGTRIEFRGRATRALQSAALLGSDGSPAVDLSVEGDRFSARWTPTRSGVFSRRLRGEGGLELASEPAPLELTLGEDVPPEVELTYPLQDTILPADLVQLVAAEARDDHGIATASLVSWRVAAAGGADAPRDEPIRLDGDA